MKCIKLINEVKGTITRVSDIIAYKKVSEGTYVYVPKSEWKKERGDTKSVTSTDQKPKAKKEKVVTEKPKVEKKEEKRKDNKQKGKKSK